MHVSPNPTVTIKAPTLSRPVTRHSSIGDLGISPVGLEMIKGSGKHPSVCRNQTLNPELRFSRNPEQESNLLKFEVHA